jgi:pheromone alpha factor receptor
MSDSPSDDPYAPGGPLFDPHSQNVTLYYPDASFIDVSLAEFTFVNYQAIRLVTVFATQVGACIVLSVLLALLTRPEKRRTLLFWVNLLALLFVVIRSLLQIMFFVSSWYDAYSYMAWDWTDVPLSDRATSVAASTSALMLEICVEISLLLQVRVVFQSNPRAKWIVTAATSLLAATAVAFFAAATVRNARVVLAAGTYTDDWVYRVAKATFAASICLFSAIFVAKLGLAIRQRRILGLQKFGPLQIVFVMGCQTMIIPGTFPLLLAPLVFAALFANRVLL